MSRSYKKHPKGRGWDSHHTEKPWKKAYNRSSRRYAKTKMRSVHHDEIDDLILPTRRIEFGDAWNSCGDCGKRYFGDLNSERIEYDPWYTRISCDRYEIKTQEHIEIAKEQFKLSDGELRWMDWYVNHWNTSYILIRNAKYSLRRTYAEEVEENKKTFAKRMRK